MGPTDRRRAELLRGLMAFRADPGPLTAELHALGWDWAGPEPLAVLTRAEVVGVLDRLLAGDLSASDVAAWADRLECRDDLGYEAAAEDALRGAVFRLATPEIHDPLTAESVRALRAKLAAGLP